MNNSLKSTKLRRFGALFHEDGIFIDDDSHHSSVKMIDDCDTLEESNICRFKTDENRE